MIFWKVPAANEALLVSGGKRSSGGAQFKVVVGHGAVVVPGFRKAGLLSLDAREAVIAENCITKQGIVIVVNGVVVFRVGDDPGSIANAARRFLDQESQMQPLIQQVFGGHMRSVVGGVTVEEIITDRARLAQEVKDSTSSEMEAMGLSVDSFQIKEIEDPSGYIQALAAPHLANVQRDARKAAALANQEAARQEQDSQAKVAEYERDSEIARANAEAATQQARAAAGQSGPREQAKAEQATITEQTKVAELEAVRTEASLASSVRKPAEAEAYRIQVTAEAEARANELRAGSLAGGNLERIVSTELLKVLPDLVGRTAESLANANVTVFNGAEGVTDVLTKVLSMGFAAYRAAVGEAAGPTAPSTAQPAAVTESLPEPEVSEAPG